jgi:hypothetical protein
LAKGIRRAKVADKKAIDYYYYQTLPEMEHHV